MAAYPSAYIFVLIWLHFASLFSYRLVPLLVITKAFQEEIKERRV